MKKVRTLVLAAVVATAGIGMAYSAPANQDGGNTTMTPSSEKTMEKGKMEGTSTQKEMNRPGNGMTTGSGMNSPMSNTKEGAEKDKSPAAGDAGIKQEK